MSEVLLTGLKIGESARWHEGRLWLSNWGTQQVLAVDLDGNTEVMARVPTTIPFSIDWLPDGRLLVVAGPEGRLLRQEPDGSLVDHANLSGLGAGLNEIVVDGRGNVYVNGGTDFHPGEGQAPGFVALVTPDGAALRVAEGGEVLDTIPLDRAGFACTLGGQDGRTLFMLSAEWRMQDGFEDNVERLTTGPETGQVLTARAPAPHAGHP